jgi:pyruvate-ferredoxin/flavodoxin oxidoreductase
VFVIDAEHAVAREAGVGGASTRSCRPASSRSPNVLPGTRRSSAIKEAIEKTYGKAGDEVVRRNIAAVDAPLAHLHEVEPGGRSRRRARSRPSVPDAAPDFVKRSPHDDGGQGRPAAGERVPVDGTFPTGTTRSGRSVRSRRHPDLGPDLCIECNKCALVCPHAAIRAKAYDPNSHGAPEGFSPRST